MLSRVKDQMLLMKRFRSCSFRLFSWQSTQGGQDHPAFAVLGIWGIGNELMGNTETLAIAILSVTVQLDLRVCVSI